MVILAYCKIKKYYRGESISLSQTKSNTSFIYIVALICLIAVAIFMFSKSDFFFVNNISTEGLNNVAEDEVAKLLGTVKGENIFLVDTGALAQKVKLHPLINDAVITKKYPGTLVIRIQERMPAALILNKDKMVEVDLQGVILRYYDTWPQKDSPVVTGIKVPETIGPGQKITSPGLEKCLRFIGQAPPDLIALFGEIHYGQDEQLFVYLTSGIEVKMGIGEDYDKKLKLLRELLASTEFKIMEKAIKYIDLTAGKPVLGR